MLSRYIAFSILLFALPAHAAKPADNFNYDTIIIGAGVSGLAAAAELNKHHYKILVLEARNRIGGRVWSMPQWGTTIDLGASWIHGIDNNPLRKIVNDLSITTKPTTYASTDVRLKLQDMDYYDGTGKKISQSEIDALILKIIKFEDFIGKQLTNKNLSLEAALNAFIKTEKLAGRERTLFTYLINSTYIYEFGASLSHLSSRVEETFSHSKTSGVEVIFPTGYGQIPDYLAKNIPILLNHKVVAIHYNHSGVTIKTTDKIFHAKTVIVTLPVGVLKAGSVKFYPPLPEDKKLAIAQAKMGVLDKIYLSFPYVFWDKKTEWIGILPSSAVADPAVEIMNYYKFTHTPILLVFTAGLQAAKYEQLSDQQIVNVIMQELKKSFGNKIPEPSSVVITRWSKDPYAYGSYSYLAAGISLDLNRRLAKPVGSRLFFAGEATSETDPSTVHGAYLSGIRAASEITLTKGNDSKHIAFTSE